MIKKNYNYINVELMIIVLFMLFFEQIIGFKRIREKKDKAMHVYKAIKIMVFCLPICFLFCSGFCSVLILYQFY